MHTVLIVHAHPSPRSLNRTFVHEARGALARAGCRVIESDLYGMQWKAVFDASDFPDRQRLERLAFIEESRHAYRTGAQTLDVIAEQEKLTAADAVIFQFPLWWFGLPAILKGWIDRVFAYGLAYGYRDAGNAHRYGEGGLAGKRALLSVTVGGPRVDYGPRGINGPLDQLLFPVTHGTLFFAGMMVLPTFAVYDADRLEPPAVAEALARYRDKLATLFTEPPIPFRPQNGGNYPDRHQLADDVAPGVTGIDAHVAR